MELIAFANILFISLVGTRSASGLITKNSAVDAFRRAGEEGRSAPSLGSYRLRSLAIISIPFLRFDRYPTANNPIDVPTDASNHQVSIDTQIAYFLRYINEE